MNYYEKLLPNQKFNLKNYTSKTTDDLEVEKKIYDIAEAFSTSMNERSVQTEMGEAYMGSPPCELRLIDFLCQLIPIENALEIGTYYGLATMRIARHAKHVITIENHQNAIEKSKHNFKLNEFDNIEIIKENSLSWIQSIKILQEHHDKEACLKTYDFIFVDGDKGSYDIYFEVLFPLLRKGGIMVFDDVFFHGDIFNSFQITEKGKGVRKFLEMTKSFEGFKMLLPIGNGVFVLRK